MDSNFPQISPPAEQYSIEHHPERPRAYSTLSNGSRRSRRSSGSGPKLDKTETHDEKKRLNLNSKADPSKAINEAQPSAVALEHSTLTDLRTMQYKDAGGNIITDPDRANPTRPRMERPLETIMSFHRAAEYTDSTRRSPYSAGPGSKMDYYPAQDPRAEGNRRSSYYSQAPSSYGPQPRTRPPGGGYYGRNSSYNGFRPESFVEEGMGSNQYQPNRSMRNSHFGTYGPNVEQSPTHSHQISYETMTSGSEENAKTTNPSSVNSSLDHIQPYRKPEEIMSQMNSYGSNNSTITPYGHPAAFNQNGNGPMQNGNSHMRTGSAPMSAPPVNNPRVPIKLNSSSMTQAELEAEAAKLSPVKEKRKSWLKRRFSRRDA